MCVFFARILYNMEHTITTAYDPGSKVNYHRLIASVFGIGQGSTDGPSGWTCISDPLLMTYHKRCKGCSLQDPTNTIKVQANVDMFVDNNTLAHNNSNKEAEPEELMYQIQNDTEMWGRLLSSSGRQLEFSKSSYSLMNWKFNNNGRPYLTKEQDLPINQVLIKDYQGEGSQLKRTTTNEGVKILGVIKAITMNDSEEFDYLLAHTKTYSKASIVCPLKPHEIWIGYQMIYSAFIRYPLSMTSLSETQVTQLHRAIVPRTLARMGYQRTIPRGIVFGTKFSGGFGFTHIGAIQTAQKICGAVKHIRAQSKIGRKCIVMLRWAQVFLGMNVPVLEETRNVDHLEGRWIRTLLQDMQKIKCKIQLHNPWLAHPHRETDKTSWTSS